jgi:PleD family two-component response regulator
MARILIASVSSGIAVMEHLLAQKHEMIIATTMAEAVAKLKEEEVDLIMINVHFDESRMFDLMSQCKAIPKNAKTPIISFCTRDTLLMGAMHDTIAVVTKLLGAWTYLDQRESNVNRSLDAEVRRVIERCLLNTERQLLNAIRRPAQENAGHLQLLPC